MKYLKIFENFGTEITYEDIEDTLLNYIDSGDIAMEQSVQNPESDQNFFTKLPDIRLFYFLQDYLYCLSKDGKLQEDPFKHINHDEDDIQQYFKTPRWKVNTNKKAIHFYLTINNGFTNKVIPDFIDKEELEYLQNKMSTYATSLKRRFIFQILKQIFCRIISLYPDKKIDIFYKVSSTYNPGSSDGPLAKIRFRIEFPDEKITESIQVNEFTPDFLDVYILDDKNTKIGSFQLESYDGKNFTIIDALIEEDYRMQGFYRKSIIELLEKHPEICIISVFRSEGAERAWKKLLETLPKGFHFTEKHHKEENTTEFKLFKAINFEEVEKETFLSFEYEGVDFPETELKVIQKISPEIKFRLDFYDTKNKIHFVTSHDKKNVKSMSIEKKEDGWYLVFETERYPIATNYSGPAMEILRKRGYEQPSKNRYFVCDQFDGLTELLEKIK